MLIYLRLIRPGLLLMVIASMSIAALTAERPPPWSQLAHALLGTALLIAGATAMNQLAERRSDARMTRTASRPLPSGRASAKQIAAFAVAASLLGIIYLAALQPLAVTILAVASWNIYVLLYTPLKRTSVWHLPVGAVAGAMPVLIGAATADAAFTSAALALAAVVFFWQLPHTAAIGWIYREEYARGTTMVAAVVDPSGRLAGRLAVLGAAGAMLASLIPATLATSRWPYAAIVVVLGLIHLAAATRFLTKPSDATARTLWRISLFYLPALLASLVLAMTV
jgi:heme o synthase